METKAEWTPLPTSNADNLYNLMADVCKAIEEEPRRFDMAHYVTAFQGRVVDYLSVKELPSCGTVGCYAGWMDILLGQREFLNAFNVDDTLYVRLRELFISFKPFEGLQYGTKKYAEKAISNLQEFMTLHETELRASKRVNA